MKKTTEIETILAHFGDMLVALMPSLMEHPRALPVLVEIASRHHFQIEAVETKNHATGSKRAQGEVRDLKTGNSAKVDIITSGAPQDDIGTRLLAMIEDIAESPAIHQMMSEAQALAKKRSDAAKKAAKTKRAQAAEKKDDEASA